MAKIFESIDGYAEMTAEQKIAALEAIETQEQKPDAETDKLKLALAKANSEAAEWKRQFREKQTEQERAESERKEHENAILEELKSYKEKERVSAYTAKLLAAGYDADTAAEMAAGLPDGVTDAFFDRQKTFIESQKKAYEDAAINKQLTLTHGAPPAGNKIEEPMIAAFRKAALGK